MSEDTQLVLIGNIFRIVCLLVGFGFAYLGYRLYVKGVFDKAQEINASFGTAKIALRQVAPGIVFGVAGIVVSILSVVRPIEITTTTAGGSRHISNTPLHERNIDSSDNREVEGQLKSTSSMETTSSKYRPMVTKHGQPVNPDTEKKEQRRPSDIEHTERTISK